MLIKHLELNVPATLAWRLLIDTDEWPRWGRACARWTCHSG